MSTESLITLLFERKGGTEAYVSRRHRDVVVVTKKCPYHAERISPWVELFWENDRPWYRPWRNCVGFSVGIPSTIRLVGEVPIRVILEEVGRMPRSRNPWKDPLGADPVMLFEIARDLVVHF